MDKAVQTGEESGEAQDQQPMNFEDVVLKEYEASPSGPTLLTGNAFMDYINRTLDALIFGEQGEACAQKAATTAGVKTKAVSASRNADGDCEGNTDYTAFFSGLCLRPAVERSFAPLPTAVPVGRFSDSDPFTREVLNHLCKDEPETHLPYIHFHRARPAQHAHVLAEGPPSVPGWSDMERSNE